MSEQPRTAEGQEFMRLFADLSEGIAEASGSVLDVDATREMVLAIEAEAAAGTEDAPMHTDEEYIEYGVVQYRRGRAQAEAEAATAAVPPADAWQAGYEACWNRLKDAGRLLPSSGEADVEELLSYFGHDYEVDGRVEWHSVNCLHRKTWAMGGDDEPPCIAARSFLQAAARAALLAEGTE